jgi:hypothetical protein
MYSILDYAVLVMHCTVHCTLLDICTLYCILSFTGHPLYCTIISSVLIESILDLIGIVLSLGC